LSRELKVPTQVGTLDVLAIYRVAGLFEGEWSSLNGVSSDILDLVTTVPSEVWDQALEGWSKPLVSLLGREPAGCLKKLPAEAKVCEKKSSCPFFSKRSCFPEGREMPWCYVPSGFDVKVADLIVAWREGKYVIVVDYEATL